MKRALKVGAVVVLGWVALWIVFFSIDLFLVAVVIGLVIRILFVMEQRDEVQADLVGAWFKIAGLEHRLKNRGDVVEVPVVRFEHQRNTW